MADQVKIQKKRTFKKYTFRGVDLDQGCTTIVRGTVTLVCFIRSLLIPKINLELFE